MRSIGDSLSSEDQSPFQTPDVNGCSTPAARAHWNACGSSASTSSTLLEGSCVPYEPPFVLSGSFQRSQPRTRESLPKAPTTPFTYVSRREYPALSCSALAPGL